MGFTEDGSRVRFASMVLHDLVPPPAIFALGEMLAGRMRELSGGRLWMGAHMRRGDCK